MRSGLSMIETYRSERKGFSMKRIFVLAGLLPLVAACSGASDAPQIGGGYTTNQYLSMRASNEKVTSLAQTVTNRTEIVEYAKKMGVVITSDTTQTTASTDGRYASSGTLKPGHSSNPDDREKIPVFNMQYDTAINAFKSMHRIHVASEYDYKNMTDAAIRSGYLIAGGDVNAYNWDELTPENKSEIKEFVDGVYASVLDMFFERETGKPDTWDIEARDQDLDEVALDTTDGTNTIKFNLNDEGEIIGIKLGKQELKRINKDSIFDIQVKGDGYTDTTRTTMAGYGAAKNLKYADFGTIVRNTTRKFMDNTLQDVKVSSKYDAYAGGYDLKQISRSDIAGVDTDMTFDGMAVGYVVATDGSAQKIAGNANLRFKNAVETLTLGFAAGSDAFDGEAKWYDTVIINDGNSSTISFRNNDKVEEKYQLAAMGDSEHITIQDYTGANVKYYGDNNTPSEFVGTATYTETVDDVPGVTMNAGFGGTIVKPTSGN